MNEIFFPRASTEVHWWFLGLQDLIARHGEGVDFFDLIATDAIILYAGESNLSAGVLAGDLP